MDGNPLGNARIAWCRWFRLLAITRVASRWRITLGRRSWSDKREAHAEHHRGDSPRDV